MFEALFGFDFFDRSDRDQEYADFLRKSESAQSKSILDFQRDKEEQEREAIQLRAYIKAKKE